MLHANTSDVARHQAGRIEKRMSVEERLKGFRLLSRFGFGQSPRLRRRNPEVGGMLDVITQPVFDSFSIAANTAFPKTTLFQTPVGSGGKTSAQTNMSLAGQLPAPQKLIVYAIRLFISNDTVIVDVNNILRNVSTVFTVGKKPWLEVPPLFLSAGCGAQITAAAQVGTAPAGSAPFFATSNGSVDPRAVFTLSKPIVIESGETFSFVLNAETAFNTAAVGANPAGAGTTIYVILDGELYRQVQ